jgi:hypothetical protein
MVKILYTTFVRPHLEFAACVWNPYAVNDISVLVVNPICEGLLLNTVKFVISVTGKLVIAIKNE